MAKPLPSWATDLTPVDMDGAAVLLGISRRFLVDVIGQHKHYEQRGNRKVFYPEHIAALREALCHSKSKIETGKASGTSLEPSTESAFEEALKLATGKQPLNNARSSRPSSGNVVPMAKRP
jgi:hypothetical protein